jgi:bifunctional pyridoxal-dependent enzyme with beta-cystathionase and maltose regulon repressor activities
LEKIAEICLKNKVVVISDEIHFDLIMPGITHTVFSALGTDAANNCVVCTSPSKTFNIAGLHISNIIIQNNGLRQKYLDALNRSDAHNLLNILAYRACEIAYTLCEPWLKELLKVVDRNRALSEQFIQERVPAIKVYPMEGTYLQWWDCRELGMDYPVLEQFMTEKALLFLSDGYEFGECGQGFERIDLACPTATLQAGLDRLAAALHK